MKLGANRKAHDLLHHAQHGNAEAFAQLFKQHSQAIWRVAFSILHNEHTASDALQETALKAWRNISCFKGESNLETWLIRIAINASYDMQTKASREEPHDVREAELKGYRVLTGHSASVNSEESLDVHRALDQLSSDDRLILSLFYAQDLPTREIAFILNITDAAARARLARARARFKDLYTRKDSRGETNDEYK